MIGKLVTPSMLALAFVGGIGLAAAQSGGGAGDGGSGGSGSSGGASSSGGNAPTGGTGAVGGNVPGSQSGTENPAAKSGAGTNTDTKMCPSGATVKLAEPC